MPKQAVLLLSIVLGLGAVAEASLAPSSRKALMSVPRGGAAAGETKKKRKKKKKKKPTDAAKEKEAIQEALKEKDSAQALGDAIRDRADDWLETDPLFSRIDASVSSVGWAMGTSDDGGSVEAAPSSVLAHYFLKSHGGAHALQSVCSLLAVLLSVGACVAKKRRLAKCIFETRHALRHDQAFGRLIGCDGHDGDRYSKNWSRASPTVDGKIGPRSRLPIRLLCGTANGVVKFFYE